MLLSSSPIKKTNISSTTTSCSSSPLSWSNSYSHLNSSYSSYLYSLADTNAKANTKTSTKTSTKTNANANVTKERSCESSNSMYTPQRSVVGFSVNSPMTVPREDRFTGESGENEITTDRDQRQTESGSKNESHHDKCVFQGMMESIENAFLMSLPFLLILHILFVVVTIWEGAGTTDCQEIALDALLYTIPVTRRFISSCNEDINELEDEQVQSITIIEDIAFEKAYPHLTQKVISSISRQISADTLEWARKVLENRLYVKINDEQGVQVTYQVSGRVKGMYSCWRKSLTRTVSDIIGLRIIIDHKQQSKEESDEERKLLFGIVDEIIDLFMLESIASTTKDYTYTNKKDNGYESVHCCFLLSRCGTLVPLEVQVRTKGMHERATTGTAAHWKYKNKQYE